MHVVFATLTPFPHIGGQATFLAQISAGLRAKGHEVAMISPNQVPASWITLIDRFSATLRIVFGSWLWFMVRISAMAVCLRLTVSRERLWDEVDVIDTQDPLTFLAFRKKALRRSIPLILTLHGYFHFESNLGSIPHESCWGGLLMFLERRAYSAAPTIVTVDTRLRDYVVGLGISKQKVVVRANFVDTVTFSPADAHSKIAARQRFGIPPGVKAICCARRMVEKTGIAFAVEAAKILRDRGIYSVLLVAGTGPLEQELRTLTSRLKLEEDVRFLGDVPRSEMPELLHACDVAIVPSISIGEEVEATSLSALEAMASGLPVVASSIGGLRELIVDGSTGILVHERNSYALADGLIVAFGPKGRHLGNAAREAVVAGFSMDNGVNSTLELYEGLKDTHAG